MGRPNRGLRLAQNEAGVYEIRWTEAGRSKRVSTRSTDAAEAADFLAVWRRQLDRERDTARASTVEAVLDAYFAEHVYKKVVAQGTAEVGRRHLVAHFGRMSPADIMPSDSREYIRLRTTGGLGRKVQGSTVRRELGILVAALNHAVRERRLPRGDMPSIILPDSNPPRERWLTDAEVRRLMETSRGVGRLPRAHRFIFLAYYTAGRKRALETLRWSQVDFETNVIHLSEPGARTTKKRRASVPMAPALRELMLKALEEAEGPWVLDHDGNIRRAFETAVRNAGLQDVSPHVMRHTAATHMLRRGVSLWQVAGILGDTEGTVARVYGKHVPEALAEAVGALL